MSRGRGGGGGEEGERAAEVLQRRQQVGSCHFCRSWHFFPRPRTDTAEQEREGGERRRSSRMRAGQIEKCLFGCEQVFIWNAESGSMGRKGNMQLAHETSNSK